MINSGREWDWMDDEGEGRFLSHEVPRAYCPNCPPKIEDQ